MRGMIKRFVLLALLLGWGSFFVACAAAPSDRGRPGSEHSSYDPPNNPPGNQNKQQYSDGGSYQPPPSYDGGPSGGPEAVAEAAPGHDAGTRSWGSNIGTGGAQDIGLFRKIVKEGGIPKPEVLDANGFFSEHHTTLPEPKCGGLFCLHGMLARNRSFVDGKNLTVLQLGLNSKKDISQLPRLPLNLLVVVDTSGSMGSQNKINYVRQGLTLMVDKLKEGDIVGIVTYSSGVSVLRKPGEVTDGQALKRLIGSLKATGSTNFYGGLEEGFKQVLKNFSEKRQNRVILLSDGMPTAGITSASKIIAMSNSYVKKGIGLTTIGMGSSFNVKLMRTLAESGSGNFYFLEDSEAVREVFQDEMDYFVVPIASDVRIKVQMGQDFAFEEIFGTNLWKQKAFGGEIVIPSVFLTGRKSHKDPPAGQGGRRGGGSAIMLRLQEPPNGMPLGQSFTVAELSLSYRAAGETKLTTQQETVVYQPEQKHLTSGYYSHKAIEKNYVMLNIYVGLRETCRLATQKNDLDGALALLEGLEKKVTHWNSFFDDEDIKADLELVAQLKKNLIAKGAKTSPTP